MRLIIAAVGRLKDAERALFDRYAERSTPADAPWGLAP